MATESSILSTLPIILLRVTLLTCPTPSVVIRSRGDRRAILSIVPSTIFPIIDFIVFKLAPHVIDSACRWQAFVLLVEIDDFHVSLEASLWALNGGVIRTFIRAIVNETGVVFAR